jgi:peroxiredoxin
MKRLLILLMLIACAASLYAAPPNSLGEIKEFSLEDTAGTKHGRHEWRDKKAVLLLFIGLDCPVSNGYAPEMQRLVENYATRGVACYAVHADPDVTAEMAATHAKEYGLKFSVLLDPLQALARQAGARYMPEAVVLSKEGQIVYRGRIDDRYTLEGKRRDQPQTHELEDALEAVLAGKEPPVAETKVYGCRLPKLR